MFTQMPIPRELSGLASEASFCTESSITPVTLVGPKDPIEKDKPK